MDRLERKTNLFYKDYLPGVKDQIAELKESGQNTSELERLLLSLEEAIYKKDYLNADYLINLLLDELSTAREKAGLPGNSIYY